MPGPDHRKWRKLTHDPFKAGLIGFVVGLMEGKPLEGAFIGFMHVQTDKLFNPILYRRRWRR